MKHVIHTQYHEYVNRLLTVPNIDGTHFLRKLYNLSTKIVIMEISQIIRKGTDK